MKTFLLPREHGAYAQLAFPLLSGLLMARPTLPAVGFALAAVGCFLAYEPLVVLLGTRGVRLQREQSDVARAQVHVLTIITVPVGLLAFAFAAPRSRWLVLVPLAWAAALAGLLFGRKLKTLIGEIVVAGALASMHVVVAAASGVAGIRLWGPPMVWCTAFMLSTFAVHAIKARLKQRDYWIRATAVITPVAGGFLTLLMMAAAEATRTLGVALLIPFAAVEVVNLLQLHPRALKLVGWALVAADTLTLAVLLFL